MIRYLIDSSAVWRILRDDALREAWAGVISDYAIGSCRPQRTEFRRSARGRDEYEEMTSMFADLYPDVTVPKSAWQWVDSAQYRLMRAGAHRALSCVDLLICACAAVGGLTVLHDDNDFVTAARHLPDLSERRVLDLP
ncbi:ribonuclease VapC6 [Actinoplanes lobatus]|uniref:Ribonuclease VapC n=1 Tax=Actinoplanes lobatus TaxID=113568 RepID=A0A7W7H8W6_9ACTN|nr:PIN domain-containing protein [Actinoplanes lobatus]MBB4746188.1 putative nucleic acid-binding protein [Actinoplanes lobatus]GGN61403.1 ribonuclease VapC6 [Actinoplanes lobatus]GIE41396.1 ribonuclease VapC [Actinoplanes lobatus]